MLMSIACGFFVMAEAHVIFNENGLILISWLIMIVLYKLHEHEDSEKKNVAEVILAKHRGGSTGTVDLAWLPSYTKFANLERRYFEEQ